ncbi:MAG: hypothetical protein ACKOIZ_12650, partial [Actinomycetota bacterium]
MRQARRAASRFLFGIRTARTRTPSRKRASSAASPTRRRAAFAVRVEPFFLRPPVTRLPRRLDRAMYVVLLGGESCGEQCSQGLGVTTARLE